MPQGTTFGPLLFLVYINDLRKAIGHKLFLFFFADDASIWITSSNTIQFQNDLPIVLGQLNNWFKVNLFSLNSDKAYLIQFTNKITSTSDIQITYEGKQIHTAIDKNFLGYLLIILFLGKETLNVLSLNWALLNVRVGGSEHNSIRGNNSLFDRQHVSALLLGHHQVNTEKSYGLKVV
jgi:hypothetical protein